MGIWVHQIGHPTHEWRNWIHRHRAYSPARHCECYRTRQLPVLLASLCYLDADSHRQKCLTPCTSCSNNNKMLHASCVIVRWTPNLGHVKLSFPDHTKRKRGIMPLLVVSLGPAKNLTNNKQTLTPTPLVYSLYAPKSVPEAAWASARQRDGVSYTYPQCLPLQCLWFGLLSFRRFNETKWQSVSKHFLICSAPFPFFTALLTEEQPGVVRKRMQNYSKIFVFPPLYIIKVLIFMWI